MRKVLIVLIIIFSGFILAQTTNNLQFVVIENNPAAVAPNFEVKIQINCDVSHRLGSSMIKFNYNNLGLSTPILVTAHNYSSGFYSPMTVSELGGGIASININLGFAFAGFPVNVASLWSDVATVGFTITDPNQSSGLVFRSISEGTDPTVILDHDQVTPNVEGTFAGLDVSLPVELAEFTADEGANGVELYWRTESEIENLGFLLDRRTESTDWTEIASYKTNGSLMGQGSTSSATDYEYLDNLVLVGKEYEYRLADIDYDGVKTYHATRTVTVEQAPLSNIIEQFTVLPAYPNPFNPNTTITYGLDNESNVTLEIYDISGKLISTLINTKQTQGWHSVKWYGTNAHGEQVPAGIYLSKVTSGRDVKTTKLMLLK